MSVYFCLPSCRPKAEAAACFAKWRAMGYRIAVLRQGGPLTNADLQIQTGEYLGWARSTNIICRRILELDPEMTFCVGGGDDYAPDMKHTADKIADQCQWYFAGPEQAATFGVMQPTGDRWGDTPHARTTYGADRGAYLDRIAGSPWMGREWIERAYLGDGPLWSGYHHCFADEELQEVAMKLGRFWQRRDLTQYHDHPGRTLAVEQWPPHLAPAITGANWDRDKALFVDRKRKGFPGHEAISL